jgi:hypothetical protein
MMLLITSSSVVAENYIETDVQMNNIDNIGASFSIPLPYVHQALVKMEADGNGDWYVTSSEASSFLEDIDNGYKMNLSMDDESLTSEVRDSFIMDFKEPRDVLINYVTLDGLRGDINDSTLPVVIVFSFTAIFDIEDGEEHSISIDIDDSFSDMVKLKFTAPDGWEIGEVKGLDDTSFSDSSVEGVPNSQVDIKLIVGNNPLFMALCFLTVLVVVVVAILVVFTITRKREELSRRLMFWHTTPSHSEYDVQPVETVEVIPEQKSASRSHCDRCGNHMQYVEKYDKYYCSTCKILK